MDTPSPAEAISNRVAKRSVSLDSGSAKSSDGVLRNRRSQFDVVDDDAKDRGRNATLHQRSIVKNVAHDDKTVEQVLFGLFVFTLLLGVVVAVGLSATALSGNLGMIQQALTSMLGLSAAARHHTHGWNRAVRQAPDQRADIQVGLEQIYAGDTVKVEKDTTRMCDQCGGSGAEGGKISVCATCGGSGQVRERMRMGGGMVFDVANSCPMCGGSGRMVGSPCSACAGKRLVRKKEQLQIPIPRGLPEGDCIVGHCRIEGMADENVGFRPGDLMVCVSSARHTTFKRVNDTELVVTVRISLLEALVGFTREIRMLDESTVTVSKTDITSHGEEIVVHGKGMPVHGSFMSYGDLHVIAAVRFPQRLTKEQKEAVSRLLS